MDWVYVCTGIDLGANLDVDLGITLMLTLR